MGDVCSGGARYVLGAIVWMRVGRVIRGVYLTVGVEGVREVLGGWAMGEYQIEDTAIEIVTVLSQYREFVDQDQEKITNDFFRYF